MNELIGRIRAGARPFVDRMCAFFEGFTRTFERAFDLRANTRDFGVGHGRNVLDEGLDVIDESLHVIGVCASALFHRRRDGFLRGSNGALGRRFDFSGGLHRISRGRSKFKVELHTRLTDTVGA